MLVFLVGSPKGFVSVLSGEEANKPLSYSRDVRPILSAKCFACHGPDPETREADLRLDDSRSATAKRDGTIAIVPGKPAESELWKRIISTEEFEQMPPPDSKSPITDREKAILKRWIEQGATYETHWSFRVPQRPRIPHPKQHADWVRNDIDRFVLRRLQMANLAPNPEADKYTLIRRVHLDLIGLPPSPEQTDRFVEDERPDAYERLVDELLRSPHYGERWARKWLDLARYSDTNGYEKDRPRSMFLYRDWVINALNNDLPFDQFTIEQIAGDLLPDATESQRIATGFHRNTMLNEEGGVDPREFRFLAMVDRVNTTATTWLGLTFGCARCHSHKYDPIQQVEYYQMMAFLDNVNEPTIKVSDDRVSEQRSKVERRLQQLKKQLAAKFPLPQQEAAPQQKSAPEQESTKEEPGKENPANKSPASRSVPNQPESNDSPNAKPDTPVSDSLGPDNPSAESKTTEAALRRQNLEREFDKWWTEQRNSFVDWTMLTPQKVETNLPDASILEDKSVLISGDYTKKDIFEVELKTDLKQITGFRLEALPDESLPFGGPGRGYIHAGVEKGGEFFLSEIYFFQQDEASHDWKQLPVAAAQHSFARDNRLSEFSIDGKSDTGWSIAPRTNERHSATFRLVEPIRNTTGTVRFKIRLEHESFHPSGLGRFRLSVTDSKGGLPAFDRPLAIDRLLKKQPTALSSGERQRLRQFFLETTPLLADEHKKIEAVRKTLQEYPTALVFQERKPEHHRTTFRHHRGEFLNPREPVEAAVPDFLHNLPSGATQNRLTFARWLVSRDNPLTARVVVNRQWEALFGRGIVRTTEDFGLQGDSPTHPELLDWLAIEFVDRGWSMKALHKLIVMSATYRQSSMISPEKMELDPENRWLSHAPRFRLDAELVRDNALAASGLLSRKIGGPSVFPPQPPGITEAAYGSLKWVVSRGEDRYRRGLYTFNKRTVPYTMFSTFDAPSGESCLARRDSSNTPLQALTTLNSTVFTEASQHLAKQILALDLAEPRQRIEMMFRRCVVRPPSQDESEVLLDFLTRQHDLFATRIDRARTVAGIEKNDMAADTEIAERAAWTALARVILNLDETITRP